jgi:hypothetical protein
MSTPSSTYFFRVDMLDETPRFGSHLRIKPEHGFPFWIKSTILPKRLRYRLRRMNAEFTLTCNVMQKFNGSCSGPNQSQFLQLIGKPYVEFQTA